MAPLTCPWGKELLARHPATAHTGLLDPTPPSSDQLCYLLQPVRIFGPPGRQPGVLALCHTSAAHSRACSSCTCAVSTCCCIRSGGLGPASGRLVTVSWQAAVLCVSWQPCCMPCEQGPWKACLTAPIIQQCSAAACTLPGPHLSCAPSLQTGPQRQATAASLPQRARCCY